MSKILYTLLHLQNQMRLYHWQTNSFARHKGSDMLVTELNLLVDNFIEVYQGIHKVIKLDGKTNVIRLKNISDKDIVAYLLKKRSEIVTLTKKMKNTDLLNIRDEIVAVINKTLYLFRLK